MNPKVDSYIGKAQQWGAEMEILREILLGCGLKEELKWGKPCYTSQGSNVVILLCLKDRCSLLFSKGALLKDDRGLLFRPTENTQAARRLEFTSVPEITKMQAVIRSYILEAIALEESGAEITYKTIDEHVRPEELEAALSQDAKLNTAFEALTPGRQRGYLLHIAGAKQSQTRVARMDKCRARILAGKGLND